MITFHFLNVGQGNMAVGLFPNGEVLVYDCNITDDNESDVFNYLERIIPFRKPVDIFVNSHRDADHMRGIEKLHAKHPISNLWDSGVTGNTDSSEYQIYMDLRRNVFYEEVSAESFWKKYPWVRVINSKRENLSDTNSQSIVLQVNFNGSSLLLAGDSSATA